MDNPFDKPTRTIRIELTKDDIQWLVSYAMINGFDHNPTWAWDIGEQNRASKWAIQHLITATSLE